VSPSPGNWQDGDPAAGEEPATLPVALPATQPTTLPPTLINAFKGDRVLPILVFLGLIGFALYLLMEPKVFPSASIDLKLSQAQIGQMSGACAKRLGYDLGSGAKKAIQSTTFTYSDDSKTFLEYQLGVVRANELMKEKIPVWSWTTRYCKEFDMEQFRVWLSPQGKMTAFEHTFEDERPLPSISHEMAKKMSAEFVRNEAAVDVSRMKLLSDTSTKMAHRQDHNFCWEDQAEDFKGGHIEYFVAVSGNQVSAYSKVLHVPEKWSRDYSKLRTVNDLLEEIASFFYEPMQFLAYLAVPVALSRGMIRYRVAIFGGTLMAFISAVNSVNDFSSVVDAYGPNSSFRDYLTSYYLRELLSVLGTFISGATLFAGADFVYRLAYPKRVALESYLTSLKAFKSVEGLKAVVAGYSVGAIHLGWIIAYYLIGDKLGFWCPLGIDAYQTLGTYFPFFSAISLGVHASWQEETVARLVALSVVQKLTGKFWLANLFQAAAWGFMHSTYPQQPAYARGVELTICGLFYGWIMRRYGLIPCLIGHYLVDAFLDVKPLFSADSATTFYSAFVPIVPFALLFLVSCIQLRKTPLTAENTIAYDSLPLPVAPDKGQGSEDEPFHYHGLPKKTRLICATVAAALMLITVVSQVPSSGDDKHLKCSQAEAIEKAKAVLEANGIHPQDYLIATDLDNYVNLPDVGQQVQYIIEKVGKKRTHEIVAQYMPGYMWQIRFFRILDPNEYVVQIGGDGAQLNLVATKEEDAPGQRLSREAARDKALAYVHLLHPELKDVVVDDVSLHSRKNRDDWTVEFSVPSLRLGEAACRMSASLLGDLVCNYDQNWIVPDSWVQEKAQETGFDLAKSIVRNIVRTIVSIVLIILVFQVLKAGRLPWKVGIFLGALCGVLAFCEHLNHLPALYYSYDTDKDQRTFLSMYAIGLVSSMVTSFASYFVASTFMLALYRQVTSPAPVAAIIVTAFRPPNRAAKLVQEQLWIDGIIIGALMAGLYCVKDELDSWLSYWFSPDGLIAPLSNLCSFPDYWNPVASDVLELFTSFLTIIAGPLVIAALMQRYKLSVKRCFLLWFFYTAISASDEKYLVNYLISVGTTMLYSFAAWYVVSKLARFNPVVYAVEVVIKDAVPFLCLILIYAWPVFASDFVSLSFYLLFPLFILLYIHVRNRTEKSKQLPETPST